MEMERGRQRSPCRALDRRVRGEHRVVFFGQLHSGDPQRGLTRARDDQQVVQLDGLERRAKLVKSVLVATDDLQVEVELGARGERERQSAMGFRPARYLTARSL